MTSPKEQFIEEAMMMLHIATKWSPDGDSVYIARKDFEEILHRHEQLIRAEERETIVKAYQDTTGIKNDIFIKSLL